LRNSYLKEELSIPVLLSLDILNIALWYAFLFDEIIFKGFLSFSLSISKSISTNNPTWKIQGVFHER
jgi:hypothetical protein